jgi:Predicted ATP-dependent serine protease
MICGTLYSERLAFCWGCLSDHTIVSKPDRPQSFLASEMQISTAGELVAQSWNLRTATAYSEIKLLSGAMTLLVGGPGAGKSTMLIRFLNSVEGPTVLLSIEEGLNPSLSSRLNWLGVTSKDFHVWSGGHLDNLVAQLKSVKPVALGIDSLNVSQLLPSELRKIQSAAKIPLVFCSQQITKVGLPAGYNSWSHEADVIFRIENMEWIIEKSRYQSTGTKGKVFNGRN